jgi:beta-phosphoglucomutase-like phosphatase (HAD superfamily)
MLGVPDPARGFLFDLDGVLTQTAKQHAAAWKLMFDEFLAKRARESGQPFVPFDSGADYDTYVDGKPRLAGTQSFLASRHIELPTGTPQDPPGTPTVHGLSNQKNDLVLELIRTQGVTVYPGSVRYLHAVRDAGLPRAVVTSSANAEQVLTTIRWVWLRS